MTTFYDVPAEDLIEALADELDDRIEAPDWADFAKTGSDSEFPPEQEDFYSRRAASLLRKVGVNEPVGIERLSTAYGGTKRGTNRYQVSPDKRVDGSKSLIRTILQDLEAEGLVETAEGDGRVLSEEGHSLLDQTAAEVLEDLDRPELEKYA